MPKLKQIKSSSRYRDTKTGALVSKATWKRSKAQGGKRYKRETVSVKEKKASNKKSKKTRKKINSVLDSMGLSLGEGVNLKGNEYFVKAKSDKEKMIVRVTIEDKQGGHKTVTVKIREKRQTELFEELEYEPYEYDTDSEDYFGVH